MWHYALLCRLVVFVIHFVILHLICQSRLKYFVLLDQMVLHIIFLNEKPGFLLFNNSQFSVLCLVQFSNT